MNKKILAMSLITVACLALAACGKKEETAIQPEAIESTEAVASTEETESTESKTVTVEESVAEESNDNYADLAAMPKEEIIAFAESIKLVVASKDVEGLADLFAYPAYVALGEGIEVQNKEELIAIGADALFTKEFITAIQECKTDNLEISMAGVVLGDITPSISFNIVKGKLGIQGISY